MASTKPVRDLMVPISDYPLVYDTDSLKEAIVTLKNYMVGCKEYRSLLVFSKTKKIGGEPELVGILTIRDILNAIKRITLSYSGDELYVISWAWFYQKKSLKDTVTINVHNALRPLVYAFVQADQDVTVAIRKMMTKNVNILPVFEGHKPVGILRTLDILDYISDMLSDSGY